MKTIAVLILAVLLFGCSPILDVPMILNATWSGSTVALLTSGGWVYFNAPRSSAGIDTTVQIAEIDGHWYIWGAGKPQNEIYRITH